MLNLCLTTECFRANQIRFSCDVIPLNILYNAINFNDKKEKNMEEKYERVIEAAAMTLGYSGSRENQKLSLLHFLERNDAFVLLYNTL